jgi:hypothetical protein
LRKNSTSPRKCCNLLHAEGAQIAKNALLPVSNKI